MSVLSLRVPAETTVRRSGWTGERRPEQGDALATLREQITQMTGGMSRLPLATPPELSGLLDLRTGGAYQVDNAALLLSLLAGPSQTGSWVGVVGAGDLGIEAAAEAGVDLRRVVVVPDPGEHWVEVTAALIDVTTVVVLRPPADLTERTASRLAARLRKRSTALISWGRWPGAEARLSLETSTWEGIEQGHGRLRSRRMTVAVRRGSAPPRYTEMGVVAAVVTPHIRQVV